MKHRTFASLNHSYILGLAAVGAGFALTLAGTTTARAAVTQPNTGATQYPIVNPNDCGDTNGNHHGLAAMFPFRSEAIDYKADAQTTPSSFLPSCGFSGTLIDHGGSCTLDFGWYNVNMSTDQPPLDSDVHVLVPASANAGCSPAFDDPANKFSTFNSNIIQNDPNYQGGLIGFAIIGSGGTCSQTHYSEQRVAQAYCPGTANGTACPANSPRFAEAIVYKSTQVDNAYYVAFEDLPWNNNGGGGDNDFNDDVYFVTGLKECLEAGNPCDTGLKGICALGTVKCSESVQTCDQLASPTTETCNGLDDNCDGTVDEGNNLCPSGQICDRGRCVGVCTDSGTCPLGTSCDTNKGACVDTQCVGVTCAAGQLCKGGTCSAPCDGVTCPQGQSCRLGRCVDACVGITCGDNAVCNNGVCYPNCSCKRCAAGQTCRSDGTCVISACADADTRCKSYEFCNAQGQCVNRCNGAVCPEGQTCDATKGACVNPCMNVNCAAGQVCNSQGKCEDACLNTVKCPSGTFCQAGVCHDACEVANCNTQAGYYCVKGQCVNGCENVTCSQAGQTCLAGTCVDACIVVAPTCSATQKCVNGSCVSACMGVDCGANGVCTGKGVCKPACVVNGCASGKTCNTTSGVCESPDAGVDAGGADSGATGAGGASGNGGVSGTAGTSGTAGASGIAGSSGSAGTSGTAGTSGNAGTSGTAGANGTAGTSGTAGSSGTNNDGGSTTGAGGSSSGTGGAVASNDGGVAGVSGGGASGGAGSGGSSGGKKDGGTTTGGAGAAGGSDEPGAANGTSGCSCDLGTSSRGGAGGGLATAFVVAGALMIRRRRRGRH